MSSTVSQVSSRTGQEPFALPRSLASTQFLKANFPKGLEVKERLVSFSNLNFKIKDLPTNKECVLRIPNEISRILANREEEKDILEWARRENISLLEVLAHDVEEGYLLTAFLSGSSFTSIDFQTQTRIAQALELLHRIHSSQTAPIHTNFEPMRRYNITEKVSASNQVHLPTEIVNLAKQLNTFLEKISKDRFQKLPCHNDPSPGNFFQQNGNLYLHDWELCALNDPAWDLAHFSITAKVSHIEIFRLYRSSDQLIQEKYYFFQPFVLFNTLVWCSLERNSSNPALPRDKIEALYTEFLDQISMSLKSDLFQTSYQKLLPRS